ncbi:WD40 repeat protein [Tahibacter aquaticus]|uniref:WD40 repeat protein n=1 Tax=Tahibacter aquaticus TaxID=520092 RepID=A0A4V3DN13_9GAMM|nr:PD40 domain-containing protein [Tahibacter aquaticus]TDR46676.1 WD40 repeat protein [Tahibacter aquaticus]
MRALLWVAGMAVASLFGTAAWAGFPPASFTDRLEGDTPSSITVGSSVSLSWSAVANACYYNGSSFPGGVSFPEWPTDGTGGGTGTTPPSGSLACDRASTCAAPHNYNLFLPNPGTYRFVVNCISFSGGPAITSTAEILVVPTPTSDGVALTATANTPGPVRPGGSFDLQLALVNRGGFRLTAPSTSLTLPAEASVVSSACATGSGSSYTWSLPNGLAAGESATCKVTARLNSIPASETIALQAQTRFSILQTSFSLSTSETIGTSHRSRPLSGTRSGAATTEDSVAPILSGDGSILVFSTRQRGITGDDSNNGGSDIVLKNRRDGSSRLVSVSDSSGLALRGQSTSPAISANGKAVAFIYQPSNPAKAGETGQVCSSPPNGLFRPTCTTTAPNGQPLSGPAESPSLSADGNLMVFCSSASNWVANDTNNAKDVFVMNTTTGAVSLVSVDAGNAQGNGDSCDAMISGSGRYVAFRTKAVNLGGTANWQVVRKDLFSRSVVRISQAGASTPANADVGKPSISYDGQRITFASRATNLIAELVGGLNNVYLSVNGAPGAAVTLDGKMPDGGESKSLGNGLFGVRNPGGGAPNGDADDPTISCNGSVVAFGSAASNLILDDSGGIKDVFVFDPEGNIVRRATTSGSGAAPNGASTNPSMDCEGRGVVFQSTANNLDPSDPNPNADVYVQDDPLHVDAASNRLDAGYSGNWFNPGQSGHGFLVEALPDGRFYLTWYLYLSGQPLFLQGVATPSGNSIDVPVYSTRSTAFPVGSGGVSNISWGRLRMTFTDSNSAAIEWFPTAFGFSAGSMTLRRLTAPAAIEGDGSNSLRACYSGVWYEPERSGYGFNLEVIEQGTDRAIVTYWYTYRPDGSPLWLSGVGRRFGNGVVVDLYQGGGSGAQFPFAFSATALNQTKWGSASLRFTSGNSLELTYQPLLEGYAPGTANLSRLTALAGRSCGN